MEAARRTQTLTGKPAFSWIDLAALLLNLPNARGARLSVLAAGFFLAACRMEDRFIFYPSATVALTPRDVGIDFKDVHFSTRDGVTLHGWYIPHRGARSTLVWFHGNAGNIGHRVENIKLLRDQVEVNIFIFDYRGYGRSQGRVSEEGTYRDGEAALELVKKQFGAEPNRTILFGRSLGAAVAAEMALRSPSQGLILESPFVSIREMARAVFPFLPIGPLLKTRYDTEEKVRKIKTPLLVLHGDRDEVVPFAQGKKVFAAAPEPKTFFTISGAGHNDTYLVGGDRYFEQLKNFVEATLPRLS
jgi:fermentation-respiration switch protein FrsA (DUF1100 family)